MRRDVIRRRLRGRRGPEASVAGTACERVCVYVPPPGGGGDAPRWRRWTPGMGGGGGPPSACVSSAAQTEAVPHPLRMQPAAACSRQPAHGVSPWPRHAALPLPRSLRRSLSHSLSLPPPTPLSLSPSLPPSPSLPLPLPPCPSFPFPLSPTPLLSTRMWQEVDVGTCAFTATNKILQLRTSFYSLYCWGTGAFAAMDVVKWRGTSA